MLRYPEDVPHATVIEVDSTVYGDDVIFRVAYQFTGEYFVYLKRDGTTVRTYLTPKDGNRAAEEAVGRFLNALVDERVRRDIATETRAIRELIVAEAFGETSLLDRSGVEADYHADPRGIAR